MVDEVFDLDENSVYPSIIKPSYLFARGCGKSQMQLQLYDAILKGEINMHDSELKKWLDKNLTKVGVDLGADKICDATVKGENEMNIKETLNKIYGKPAATNEPIKDDIGTDKTFEELLMPDKAEEEWIWVRGFKGTEKDMSCKGYHYELGKQFDLDEDLEPSVCHNGFHFCKSLENVFRHYKIGGGHRFFEVEALVRKSDLDPKKKDYATYANIACRPYYPSSHYDDKYAAKSIRFIRELTVDEVFESVTDKEVLEWTDEQKKRAMETSIRTVRDRIREETLISAGYSPAFAKYIADDSSRYVTAMAMASLTDVSMDVKIMAIFMDNQSNHDVVLDWN